MIHQKLKHGMRKFKYIFYFALSLGTSIALIQALEWCLLKLNLSLTCWWAFGLIVCTSIAVFLIQGVIVDGYLLKKATLELHNIGAKICVCADDLFKQEGVIVIGVNDFFDTLVDDIHIARQSLHGKTIQKYWPGNVADLEAQLDEALKQVQYEIVRRDGKAKEKRYPIGTSVYLNDGNGRKMIFVALTKTDPFSHVTTAKLEDVITAVRGALRCARDFASGLPVSLPLIGSGNARINLPHIGLFNAILDAAVAESNDLKISNEIRIVLRGQLAKRMNFIALTETWRI